MANWPAQARQSIENASAPSCSAPSTSFNVADMKLQGMGLEVTDCLHGWIVYGQDEQLPKKFRDIDIPIVFDYVFVHRNLTLGYRNVTDHG